MTVQGELTGRRFLAICVALVFFGTLAFTVLAHVHEADAADPGEFSSLTRHDLRTDWAKTEEFPVLVPLRLPAGARTNDEPGFTFNSIASDPAQRPARRVWVSSYSSEALGPEFSVEVFQRPKAPGSHPCGAVTDQFHLERHVAGAFLSICSNDLEHNAKARRYWATVVFTADLGRVTWLQG
ncbi:hypothetical protein ASE12_02725 [Aeromicrobium sp. Root236]|uniref:hypothetical protein n=1 Tax=Aeromicrobium sp. Root236 TaxID=1736498 RepID=UPI0006F24E4D|nr:hypothetical protein [Aeromicrobium sp. Root236]KRC63774.1 hypothetical protein ASE12_02725 [Aeromicrobium sp. Root236]